MANDIKGLFGDIAFILKFVVLILCCVCAYFVDVHGILYYMKGTSEYVVEIAVYGYLVVIAVMVIIYIFDEPQKLFEAIMLITGGLLSLAGGILSIMAYANYDKDKKTVTGKGNWGVDDYTHATERLIVGIITLVNGVIMIVDGILTALKAAGK